MITLLLHLLRLFPFLCGGHRHLALENLALRQQLAVYERTANRPKLRRSDRLFWIWLARGWAGWKDALVIVAPDTVLRWQRRRFRDYWTKLSGRPPKGEEVFERLEAELPHPLGLLLALRDGCHDLGREPALGLEHVVLGVVEAVRVLVSHPCDDLGLSLAHAAASP